VHGIDYHPVIVAWPAGSPGTPGDDGMLARELSGSPVGRHVSEVLREGGATGLRATERSRSSGSSRVGRHVRAGLVRFGVADSFVTGTERGNLQPGR
jgi:hypothetical protein